MAEVGRDLCKSSGTKPMIKPADSVASGPALVQGVVPPQVQNFASLGIEFHEVPVGPFLQPLKIPLDGSTTLQICIYNTLLGHFFNTLLIL